VFEIWHQITLRGETPYQKSEKLITSDELEYRVEKGEKLVILDDMVLDVSNWMIHHPGGRFVIEHNIGRDISKFFYGGYSLENGTLLKPYTHSNIARKIVN
jgi:cytochrome b involved in lipid metabolism